MSLNRKIQFLLKHFFFLWDIMEYINLLCHCVPRQGRQWTMTPIWSSSEPLHSNAVIVIQYQGSDISFENFKGDGSNNKSSEDEGNVVLVFRVRGPAVDAFLYLASNSPKMCNVYNLDSATHAADNSRSDQNLRITGLLLTVACCFIIWSSKRRRHNSGEVASVAERALNDSWQTLE